MFDTDYLNEIQENNIKSYLNFIDNEIRKYKAQNII